MTGTEAQRLAEDVQRFGLLSAAAIVDRYEQLVDEAMGDHEHDEGLPGGLESVDPSWLVDRASRLAGGYLRFLESATSAIGSRARPQGIERVPLVSGGPGEPAEGTLWIHNPTSAPIDHVELTATALVSVDGRVIPAQATAFQRTARGPVAASDSAEIRIVITPPPDTEPGRYFGLVHLDDGADEPLAVDLEIPGE